jgi:hypothetical protein
VHATMVNRQLQRISRVPRESEAEMKLKTVPETVQAVLKDVYAKALWTRAEII